MIEVVLKYADRFGGDVRVRFHPQNNRISYQKRFPSLKEAGSEFRADLIVGHTSSLLFEMIAKNYPAIQFSTEIPTIPIAQNLRFETESEMKAAIGAIQNSGSSGNHTIETIGAESKALYRDFFSKEVLGRRNPKFSIIVPCYNSALHINRCLDSISRQSFEDFEVIIADGASSDLTLLIAAHYADKDRRIRVFSEPDTGVYDAMNKGLRQARGDWLYFMGSDDEFAEDSVLERVSCIAPVHGGPDIIYGNVKVVGDVKWAKDGTIYDGEFTTEKIQKKNICHQAAFYRRQTIEKFGPYNTKYRLCADWDLNLKLWANCETQYLDMIVSNFNAGGESTVGTDPEFGKDFFANKKRYFGQERAI